MTNAETTDTVRERERERESYTLIKRSVALFNNLTHTSNFIKNIKGEKAFINNTKNRQTIFE